MKGAVVLISGGLDSTTVLAMALADGYDVYPMTIDYGQRHIRELKAAEDVCEHYGLKDRWKVFGMDMGQIGGSALTDHGIPIPPSALDEGENRAVPATYVPGRNVVFISLAAARAETLGLNTVFLGANAVDYSGYPDCRPEFMRAMERALSLGTSIGTASGFMIMTPIISLSKAEIIRAGMELGAPYHLTWSCYRGGEKACGICESCVLRLKGFAEAGTDDPLEYMDQ